MIKNLNKWLTGLTCLILFYINKFLMFLSVKLLGFSMYISDNGKVFEDYDKENLK